MGSFAGIFLLVEQGDERKRGEGEVRRKGRGIRVKRRGRRVGKMRVGREKKQDM